MLGFYQDHIKSVSSSNITNVIILNLSIYSNPILFVAKILLLFRQQATGNRQQATGKSFNFFIYFLICRNLCADCYS